MKSRRTQASKRHRLRRVCSLPRLLKGGGAPGPQGIDQQREPGTPDGIADPVIPGEQTQAPQEISPIVDIPSDQRQDLRPRIPDIDGNLKAIDPDPEEAERRGIPVALDEKINGHDCRKHKLPGGPPADPGKLAQGPQDQVPRFME